MTNPRYSFRWLLTLLFALSAAALHAQSLTVNGTEANYTTSHVFVDEIAGDSAPFAISYSPNDGNVDPSTVQVFTNLNRRDLATLAYLDGNGLATEEGISPPSGDVIGTNDNHYFKTYAMTANGSNTVFTTTLSATKTGAYRLTARYRQYNNSQWIYYSSNGRRDHAIVVSPKAAREISLFEVNTLNVNATGDLPSQRGTFPDLHDSSKRVNLDYVKNLGCNYMWFQPIHPNGIDGRQVDPAFNHKFVVGSPYAVKNFFEVMPLMARNFTPTSTDPNSDDRSGNDTPAGRAQAKIDFHDFVVSADGASVGVMLDAPFNHTSYDSELAQQGVNLFKPGGSATGEIRANEARFFSQGDLFNIANNNYCTRASGAGNIAPAPDRNDFGKFGDTFDIFFGYYAALVCHNNSDNTNYLNEGDWFDYSNGNWNSTDFTVSGVNNNITRNVWRFFASYIPYWLTQTGHSGVNSGVADGDYATRLALDSKGIDALRADFGQGLPPQCWEYVINVARSHKWNFVFMTESLDGGAVTYRSNRHFDILNENIIFPFQAAAQTSDYRSIFDGRRSAYGQGLVLLNNTSHDEENYADAYQALVRYGVSNTIDGTPMVFYGQELGVTRTFGFHHYEANFGKQIPQFKVFNDLGPIIGNPGLGTQYLFPDFAAMGQARQFSRALRSSNRYYLNQADGSIQQSIFSVAKYESPNGSPASTDVVFGFMNLDRNNDQQGNFNVNITQSGSNLFGIKSNRTYDVKNIAAYTGSDSNRRNVFLNRQSGASLLSNGLFVGMNKVPTMDSSSNPTDPAWNQRPFEAQYLKLYDVTAPSTTAGSATVTNAYAYLLGTTGTISWSPAAADSEGVVPTYRVNYSIDGVAQPPIYTSGTSGQISASPGRTVIVTVQTLNPSDSSVTGPSSSPVTLKFIDPNGDDDADGITNAAEDYAGTNPFDPNSIFRITSVTHAGTNAISVTWNSVPGKTYQIETAGAPNGSYVTTGMPAAITATTASTTQTVTATPPAFFRVRIIP